MFKHNIHVDQPKVLDGMHDSSYPLPLEFFMSPKFPSIPTATDAIATKADKSEATGRAEELERSCNTPNYTLVIYYMLKV